MPKTFPKKVQFFLILLFISVQTLSAMSYDDDILGMYAKLSARFFLMSSAKDQSSNSLKICLLYQNIDEKSAATLKEKIDNTYKNGIQNYTVETLIFPYSSLEQCSSSNILFLFRTDETQLQKSVAYAYERKMLTIAYDVKALESGADISLFLGRKVVPYINITALKRKGISLDTILLRISKIYTTQSQSEMR